MNALPDIISEVYYNQLCLDANCIRLLYEYYTKISTIHWSKKESASKEFRQRDCRQALLSHVGSFERMYDCITDIFVRFPNSFPT